MHRIFSFGLMLVFTIGVGSSSSALRAQTTEQQQPSPNASKKIEGTWAGTFEGDGTGKFEMSFSTAADGKESGRLSVTPDQGDGYSVDFKTLSFDGSKMNASYTSPESSDEIMMEGVLDDAAGFSGKWALGPMGSPTATGTWKAIKK
ncbi:MAG: hypothetical protein WKF30_07175 [Pyrinomonadaceae bacterium]